MLIFRLRQKSKTIVDTTIRLFTWRMKRFLCFVWSIFIIFLGTATSLNTVPERKTWNCAHACSTGYPGYSPKWDPRALIILYEKTFDEPARLTGTNVLYDAFWFAKMHSLQTSSTFEHHPREVMMNFFPYEAKLIFIPLRRVIPHSRGDPAHMNRPLKRKSRKKLA